ncbi:MAG: 50S ribosomal protein L18a [archaeon]|nr:50S ribosomal protein L18a [archaeon]
MTKMKGFRISGSFDDARQGQQSFCIEVAAENDIEAKEQTISTLGSRHKLKRWQITIKEIKELTNDEVIDHVVKYKISA